MNRTIALTTALIVVLVPTSWAFFKPATTGSAMTGAAATLLESLDDKQRATAQLEFDTLKRVGWHFIPKAERKGLQIKHMNEKQREAAHALLRSALSQIGYEKSTKIMQLEALLHELEGGKRPGFRDPEKYYFTIFGKPAAGQRWGLSFEGHHLSFNFVVKGDEVVSSTPQFLAANPGVIKNENKTGFKVGSRVLAKEELLAFDLVRSLDDKQKPKAVIADKAPREIRNAGQPQPPAEPPAGLPAAQLNNDQVKTLRALIEEYAGTMPYNVAEARLKAIDQAGIAKVHFAWAGPTKEGIGHYYRIQGPTFLIEFVNTQPDAAGNPANHIHCVWRDMKGDFGIPIAKK